MQKGFLNMKTKIILNPDKDHVSLIRTKLNANDGYCPCSIIHNEDTKCPCKSFRECEQVGACHCGLYQKIEVTESAE